MTRIDRPPSDPQIVAWLAPGDARLSTMIREHGWSIQYLMGDGEEQQPSVAHTIGLFGRGHAELVVVGAGGSRHTQYSTRLDAA